MREMKNLTANNENLQKVVDSKNNKEKFSKSLHDFYGEKIK